MSSHHFVQRALQRFNIQLPFQPHCSRNVVGHTPGSNWSRNHKRCCACDSGNCCSATPAPAAAPSLSLRHAVPLQPARPNPPPSGAQTTPATATPLQTPRALATLNCVASSECPPNSKKLSCTPTRGTRSTLAHRPAQQLFLWRARRLIISPHAPMLLRRRQRTPVDLAAGQSAETRLTPQKTTAPCSPAIAPSDRHATRQLLQLPSLTT